MRSSAGKYYQALDHVRALAAFLVFFWHFSHTDIQRLPAPWFPPLSLLTEGHTGVALFMTLSGYLFAKLLDGRQLAFWGFLRNRVLRLAPLLIVVFFLVALEEVYKGKPLTSYLMSLLAGFVLPVWPNGGWSIAVEAHFYILLPLLLWLSSRSRFLLVAAVLVALLLRLSIYQMQGTVQDLTYHTLIGRFDHFAIGILAFQLRQEIASRALPAAALIAIFFIFWNWFDRAGGYYDLNGYPSPSPVWIITPTLEAAAYATAIAWYDTAFTYSSSWLSRFIARIGTYSYSIYLLHFFVVHHMARAIDRYVIDLSSPLVILAACIPAFLCMLPIGWFSYRFIEEPFLRHRSPYIRQAALV